MGDLIRSFYSAFKNRDAESMVACYHRNIVFEGPAFGVLRSYKARNMWRMPCTNAKDLSIEFSNIETNTDNGKAQWEAHYTFNQTGKKVLNKIDTEFGFKDGKIIKHTDRFDLHQWAKQALGFKGLLLGNTSFFKKKLN